MKILQYILYSVIFGLSSLLLVFYSGTISNDFIQYQLIFNQLAASESVTEAILNYRFEPGFVLLYYSLSGTVTANSAFYIIAFASLLMKYILFIKYLDYPLTSWLIYAVLFLPFLDASQLRTAMSSAIILYTLLVPVYKEKYILQAMLASIFHYVGLIIFILIFNRKPLFGLFVVLLAGVFLDRILPMISSNILKFDLFVTSATNDVNSNLVNSISMAQLFISIYCIYKWSALSSVQKKGALLILVGLLVYAVLINNATIAHRVREVSLLGIFPLLFSSKIRITFSSLIAFSAIFFIFAYYLIFTTSELISLL